MPAQMAFWDRSRPDRRPVRAVLITDVERKRPNGLTHGRRRRHGWPVRETSGERPRFADEEARGGSTPAHLPPSRASRHDDPRPDPKSGPTDAAGTTDIENVVTTSPSRRRAPVVSCSGPARVVPGGAIGRPRASWRGDVRREGRPQPQRSIGLCRRPRRGTRVGQEAAAAANREHDIGDSRFVEKIGGHPRQGVEQRIAMSPSSSTPAASPRHHLAGEVLHQGAVGARSSSAVKMSGPSRSIDRIVESTPRRCHGGNFELGATAQ